MTLKIERISGKRRTRIRLSGEFRAAHLDQLKAEIGRGGPRVALDLEEVDLVDVEGVRFLNACEAKGVSVLHCSPYIKEWMLRERAGKKERRAPASAQRRIMPTEYKQRVVDLLKSLETKDPAPFAYINPKKYIQHNLSVADGPAGVATLIKSLPPEVTVNTIRVFQDGDLVFAHTEYNFFGPKIGFDIFRFEDGLIVEHWDNLQETATEPSPSGHTMIDGPTTSSDLNRTKANKVLMQGYMDDLIAGRHETFLSYFGGTQYIQHNPCVADTIPGLLAGLQALATKGHAVVYKSAHKILGEGNFVLVITEATFGGVPTAIYDLYRIENGKIAEHWDTLQEIPPRVDWKNDNGKF